MSTIDRGAPAPLDHSHNVQSTSQAGAAKKTYEGPSGKFESHDISKMSESELDDYLTHLDNQITHLDSQGDLDAREQALIQEFGDIEKESHALLSQLKAKKEFVTTTKDTATEGHTITADKPPVTPRETHVTQNPPNQKQAVQTNTISQHVFIPPQPKGPPPSPTQAYRPPEPATPPPSPPQRPAGPTPLSRTRLPLQQAPLQAPPRPTVPAPTLPPARSEVEQTIKMARTTRSDPSVETTYRKLDSLMQKVSVSDPKSRETFFKEFNELTKNLSAEQKSQLTNLISLRHNNIEKSLEGYNTGVLQLPPQLIHSRCNEMWALRMTTIKMGTETKQQLDSVSKPTSQMTLENAYRKAGEAILDAKAPSINGVPKFKLDKEGETTSAAKGASIYLKELATNSRTFINDCESLSKALLDDKGELKPEVKKNIEKNVKPAKKALEVMKEIKSRLAAMKTCEASGREIAKEFEELNDDIIKKDRQINAAQNDQEKAKLMEAKEKKITQELQRILNGGAYKNHLKDLSEYTMTFTNLPSEANLATLFGKEVGRNKVTKEPITFKQQFNLTQSDLNSYLAMPMQRGTRFEMPLKEVSKTLIQPDGNTLEDALLHSTNTRLKFTNQVQTLRDAA